jgi:2-methylcitrate dehydratase PrpD
MATADAVSYLRSADARGVSDAVRRQLRARVLDTLAAVTAGYRVDYTDLVRTYATDQFTGGDDATLLDGAGEQRGLAAATLSNATAANALDIDDGHREVRGHPSAVVVPPALAVAEATDATVGELLDAVLAGYELGVRAGLAIHESDGLYTGTGSWGALGAAAAVARLLGFDDETAEQALGTAEYHAPRTPITRGVERPGMTKDGIGWGAYTGLSGAQLADQGFLASGTVFDDVPAATDDLGDRHHVARGYLKPYPCCRWAHPAVDAVLELRARRSVDPAQIDRIAVDTFDAATRLRTVHPETVDAAQYSVAYPVAAALVRGEFGVEELSESVRTDSTVRSVASAVELRATSDLDARFPEECLARVTVETGDETHRADTTRPRGSRERPLRRDERIDKARRLLTPTVSAEAVASIRDALADRSAPIGDLLAPWQ